MITSAENTEQRSKHPIQMCIGCNFIPLENESKSNMKNEGFCVSVVNHPIHVMYVSMKVCCCKCSREEENGYRPIVLVQWLFE